MDEGRRDRILDRLVELMMEIRGEYLGAGANALKHWDQLHDRAMLAARTSERMSEWVSTLRRRLNLGSPSNSASRACLALCDEVDVDDSEALSMIEDELPYIMARCRVEADRRRAAKMEGEANV